MKLGPYGEKWIGGLNELFTDARSLCTDWQQTFFTGIVEKAEKFGDGAYITEKQLFQLNKIADVYGYAEIEESELDDEA
jgi:hypothetical protein